MEGADERRLHVARVRTLAKLEEALAKTPRELACGAVRERDREDSRRRDPIAHHGAHEALDEHCCLAAARARCEQQRSLTAPDGALLLLGERAAGSDRELGRVRLLHRVRRPKERELLVAELAHLSHLQIDGYMHPWPEAEHVSGRASSRPDTACAAASRASASVSSTSASSSSGS